MKDLVEAGDGDPTMRGCLTSCFSAMLKSAEGMGKLGTAAETLDEATLTEIIKCLGDTRDPAALDIIIRASRRCSHPVGAWQAPKVATAKNADLIRSFVQEETAKQPPELRDKIIASAMREFAGRGMDFAAPHAENLSSPEASMAPTSIAMQTFQLRESSSRDFEPGSPPPSGGMAVLVPSPQTQSSAGGGMTSHVRNMEAFYKNRGMVSGTRCRARIPEGKIEAPAPEGHSVRAERRDAAEMPGAGFVLKNEPGSAIRITARMKRQKAGRLPDQDPNAQKVAEHLAKDTTPTLRSQKKPPQSKPPISPSMAPAPQPEAQTRKKHPKAKDPEKAAVRNEKTPSAGTRRNASRVPKPQSGIPLEPKAMAKPKAAADRIRAPAGSTRSGKPIRSVPARVITRRSRPSVPRVPARAVIPRRKPSVPRSITQRARRGKALSKQERRKASVPEKRKKKSDAIARAPERKRPRPKAASERASAPSSPFSLALKKQNVKATARQPRSRSKPRSKKLQERLAELRKKRRQRRAVLMLLMEKRKKKRNAYAKV
jgi:hypothetical protein